MSSFILEAMKVEKIYKVVLCTLFENIQIKTKIKDASHKLKHSHHWIKNSQ